MIVFISVFILGWLYSLTTSCLSLVSAVLTCISSVVVPGFCISRGNFIAVSIMAYIVCIVISITGFVITITVVIIVDIIAVVILYHSEMIILFLFILLGFSSLSFVVLLLVVCTPHSCDVSGIFVVIIIVRGGTFIVRFLPGT